VIYPLAGVFSAVRQASGIATSRACGYGHWISILFRSPLRDCSMGVLKKSARCDRAARELAGRSPRTAAVGARPARASVTWAAGGLAAVVRVTVSVTAPRLSSVHPRKNRWSPTARHRPGRASLDAERKHAEPMADGGTAIVTPGEPDVVLPTPRSRRCGGYRPRDDRPAHNRRICSMRRDHSINRTRAPGRRSEIVRAKDNPPFVTLRD
jgi:hypothetical protein